MISDNYLIYQLSITQSFKKFFDLFSKESQDHTKFYLEFEPKNLNLYLKNDITNLYTKIELKHRGESNNSKTQILKKMETPIICLHLGNFVANIFMLQHNQEFSLIFDCANEEITIRQEGHNFTKETLETTVTICNYQLSTQELLIEIEPIRDLDIIHELQFNSAFTLHSIISSMATTKKTYVSFNFKENTAYPITIETSNAGSVNMLGKYQMKSVINYDSNKVSIISNNYDKIPRVEYCMKFLLIGAKIMERNQKLSMKIYSNGYQGFSLDGDDLGIQFYIPSKDYVGALDEDGQEINQELFTIKGGYSKANRDFTINNSYVSTSCKEENNSNNYL